LNTATLEDMKCMQQDKRMRSEAQHEFVAVAVCVSKPEDDELT